jgi:hypothetical protein
VKRKTLIICVGIGLQILVAATKFIPGAAKLWHTEDAQAFYSVLVTFVGIQVLLMTGTLVLLMTIQGSELAAAVRAALPGTEVRPMKDYNADKLTPVGVPFESRWTTVYSVRSFAICVNVRRRFHVMRSFIFTIRAQCAPTDLFC